MVGGMSRTLRLRNSLAVSGLPEIVRVFDDIERGKLKDIDFIEAYSCGQGCCGGSLTVENVYSLLQQDPQAYRDPGVRKDQGLPRYPRSPPTVCSNYFSWRGSIEPRPLTPLDPDLSQAISKRKEKDGDLRVPPQDRLRRLRVARLPDLCRRRGQGPGRDCRKNAFRVCPAGIRIKHHESQRNR